MAGILPSILLSYLLGSLNFGGLLGLFTGRDPREWGSGRLGAWNTGRRLGLRAGIIVFAGDFAKGALAVWLSRRLGTGEWTVPASALAAVFGHVYPLFFRFRGGKGLATSLGALAALDYRLALPPALVAAAVFLLTRHIYMAALAGIVFFPLWAPLADPRPPMIAFGFALAAFLLFNHRRNIADLFPGAAS